MGDSSNFETLPSAESFSRRSLVDVLRTNDHPGLSWLEKKYIGLISRGISFEQNPNGELHLSSETLENKLDSLVYVTDHQTGEKYKNSFKQVIDSLTRKSTFSCDLPFLPVGELIQSSQVALQANLFSAAVQGNPIERTLNGKGNCLDLTLTAAVIGQVFYQDEHVEVNLLPYNRIKDNTKTSRHFMTIWREKSAQSDEHSIYITRYRPGKGDIATRKYNPHTWQQTEIKGENSQQTLQNIGENASAVLEWWDK